MLHWFTCDVSEDFNGFCLFVVQSKPREQTHRPQENTMLFKSLFSSYLTLGYFWFCAPSWRARCTSLCTSFPCLHSLTVSTFVRAWTVCLIFPQHYSNACFCRISGFFWECIYHIVASDRSLERWTVKFSQNCRLHDYRCACLTEWPVICEDQGNWDDGSQLFFICWNMKVDFNT